MIRHLTKKRIISYLFYIALAGSLVMGVSYARYQFEITGEGTAGIAAVAMDTTLDLTSRLGDLAPGGRVEIEFAVTNAKENAVSQVTQEYSITISTTGNLPLEYKLTPVSPTSDGNYVVIADGSSGTDKKWTGGSLPLSAGDPAGITHHYKLTVQWPEDEKSTSYLDEIDLVTLTVDASQVKPGSA